MCVSFIKQLATSCSAAPPSSSSSPLTSPNFFAIPYYPPCGRHRGAMEAPPCVFFKSCWLFPTTPPNGGAMAAPLGEKLALTPRRRRWGGTVSHTPPSALGKNCSHIPPSALGKNLFLTPRRRRCGKTVSLREKPVSHTPPSALRKNTVSHTPPPALGKSCFSHPAVGVMEKAISHTPPSALGKELFLILRRRVEKNCSSPPFGAGAVGAVGAVDGGGCQAPDPNPALRAGKKHGAPGKQAARQPGARHTTATHGGG